MAASVDATNPMGVSPAQETEMQRLGIRRVPVDTFHVGAYRYSNLADAIAQAERIRSANAPA